MSDGSNISLLRGRACNGESTSGNRTAMLRCRVLLPCASFFREQAQQCACTDGETRTNPRDWESGGKRRVCLCSFRASSLPSEIAELFQCQWPSRVGGVELLRLQQERFGQGSIVDG